MSEADTYELLSAEENEEYSKNLSYPVYIVTYTAGENEDTREWTVFAMDTDVCTYLYGFCALLTQYYIFVGITGTISMSNNPYLLSAHLI